jgi:two-component sensor histidine kinase
MAKQDIVSTLQRLISGIDESIAIFDGKGIILHASDSLKRLLSEDQLVGKSVFEFLDGKAEGVRMWMENLSHAHFKDVRIKMLRNGHVFPARLRMAAWNVTESDFVVMASIADGTFIERRKRDLLRKALTIEQLSRSRKIRTGKLNEAIYEILEMSSKAVRVSRVNAWVFNDDNSMIECIGNYDASVPGLVPQESLPRTAMPNYFRLFETEKIILSSRQQSEVTRELMDSYLIPNNIHAMMDIPLRIEGEIIGVICFEQTKQSRDWTLQDQKFGLIAAQMVSLSVETWKRKIAQQELENMLRQQQRLMAEANHRIKNNLAITVSLMRMQLEMCRDDFHRSLMQDAINRIHSITALHELLAQSNNTGGRIRFEPYARELLAGLQESFSDPSKHIQLTSTIEECEVASSLAITLGLIINEVVTNSFKHAFNGQKNGMIRVDLELDGPMGKLMLSDTGTGFSPSMQHGQGFEIIEGLAAHMGARVTTSSDAGSTVTIDFRLR